MNNDDVKKYINLSKLYTEVQLDEKKQVDENWFTDKIKEVFGITDTEAQALDKTAKKSGIDTENPEGKDAKKAGIDNPNVEVTTQDQANSIFQNPDATDAERKAAQDFYNANKDDTSTVGDDPSGAGDDGVAQGQDNNPNVQTTTPPQPVPDRGNNPPSLRYPPDITAPRQSNTTAPEKPATPGGEQEPTANDLGANDTATPPSATPRDGGNPGGTTTAVDPDANDPRGDQTNPPANQQGVDGPADAAAQQANTKDLMTRYNEGGKKAMPEIKKLQTELGRLGFDPNGIDGKYGNGTFKAVQQFQKANGLQVDGQAGTDTLAAIKKAINGGPKGVAANDAQASAQASNDAQAAQDKADAKAKDDPMTAANQQKDIDTAQPNADVDRYIELLNKLEGGQVNAGTPNATQGQVVASYDFRNLIALVESKLLNEQLTQAEMEELKALHNKVQGHVSLPGMDADKITKALNRYLKLVKEPGEQEPDKKGPDGQYDGDDLGNAKTTPAEKPKVTLDSLSAQIKKGITMQQFEKIVKDAEALEPQDAAKDANILKKFGAAANKLFSTADYRSRYVIANGAKNLGLKGLYRPDGSSYIFIGSDGKPAGARGADLKAALAIAQVGLLPQSKVDSIGKIAAKGKPDFQAVIDAHNKATGATPQVKTQVPPSTGRPDDAGATQQNASKDNNMKKAIKEASMNISINGDSAAEVAELAGILKNAGMHDAKPVSDILPRPGEKPAMAMDPHDDMISKMSIMDEPGPDDSPCGMGEDDVEEDWDNSPEETYADTQTMTKDLSGGLNREKKAYPATQDGDNPMAVETSIKEQLWAALNEKMIEGSKKGKESRGNKKKDSRG